MHETMNIKFVINYCSDILRPQFLAVFGELAFLPTFILYNIPRFRVSYHISSVRQLTC